MYVQHDPRSRLWPLALLGWVVSGSILCGGASPAFARETSKLSLSASAQVLYGDLPSEEYAVNPYGPGLGLRLGVTLPVSLYLGISYEHFFGGEPYEWANIYSYSSQANIDQVTGWVGYEVELEAVTLRPRLGLGYANARTDTRTVTQAGERSRDEESENGLVLSPALELAFPVGAAWLIVDGRYSFLPEAVADADALMIGVGVGIDF